MEFLFGQKNGTDILESVSNEGLSDVIISLRNIYFLIHTTDFELECFHTVALKKFDKHS